MVIIRASKRRRKNPNDQPEEKDEPARKAGVHDSSEKSKEERAKNEKRNKSPVIVFAHGAGAPSSSDWMIRWKDMLSKALNAMEVVTFDFPYIAGGKRRPPPKAEKLVQFHSDIVRETMAKYPGHPIVLVGKSMGSRVSCMVAGEKDIDAVAVVCLGYPLKGMHGAVRDEMLLQLTVPVMFVQGSKDGLCPLEKLEAVRKKMTSVTELHVIEGGDHSFKIGQKHLQSGANQAETEAQAVEAISKFVLRCVQESTGANQAEAEAQAVEAMSKFASRCVQEMSSRDRYSSGQGAGGHSGAPPNETSQSRPSSSSSTPGHAPQHTTGSLPPLPSVSHCEVPTNAPSSSTPAIGSSTAPNNRLQIHVYRDSIVPSHQSSSVLRKIFESLVEYGGTSWKKVTAQTKRKYYEEFCKRCTWDPIFEDEIARLYHAKAANCYKNMISDWKTDWFGKGKKPQCVLEGTWQNFIQHWAKPEVQKKSEQMRKNRLSEPCGKGTGISKHRGGSKSAQDYALEITKQKGEPATDYDVFLRMHYVENKFQSCGKAKKIYDEVQKKAAQFSTESQPIDMSKLFVETAGIKKGRVFGIGNISKTYTNASCRSSATSSINEHEITRQINEMVEAKVEARVEAVRAEMRLEMQQMMYNMMQGRVNSSGVASVAPTKGIDGEDEISRRINMVLDSIENDSSRS